MTERGLPVRGSGEEVTPPSQAPVASQTGNWLLGTSSPPLAFSNLSASFPSSAPSPTPEGPVYLTFLVLLSPSTSPHSQPEPPPSQKCWGAHNGREAAPGNSKLRSGPQVHHFPCPAFLEVRGNRTTAGESLWGARCTEKFSGSLAGVGVV